MADSTDAPEPIEALVDAILARLRRGEGPDAEGLCSGHPGLAGDLSQLIREIDALVPPRSGNGSAGTFPHSEADSRSRDGSATPGGGQDGGGGPRLLGDYRLLREVGRGGMGVVFEAEQLSLGRRVALKILPRHVAMDSKVLRRFRREARSAARLHHSNIVPVFEVGRDGEVAYYAMQFIPGLGLDRVIEGLRSRRDRSGRLGAATPGAGSSGPPPGAGAGSGSGSGADAGADRPWELAPELGPPSLVPMAVPTGGGSSWDDDTQVLGDSIDSLPDVGRDSGELDLPPPGPGSVEEVIAEIDPGRRPESFRGIARIGRMVAQGLAYAHGRGVIHRDIKPSNLMLDGDGVAWITDFGLARLEEDVTLTREGDVLGTTRYMAPERFRGAGDARVDIYALGLTLYELLTLRPAFPTTDRLQLIDRIKSEEPPRPRSIDPGIPRDLETIVLKAIEKDPAARYPTASAMADDLGRFLDDRPIEARRIGKAERLARWCRRNPVLAGLSGAVLALLVAIAVVSSAFAVRLDRIAREARQMALDADFEREAAMDAAARAAIARRDEIRANERLRSAQEELRRNLYASRIAAALAAWDAGDVGRLDWLLEQARSQDGAPDLLGWEWDYLRRLSRQERVTFRAHSREVSRVAFSPDGRSVASVQWGGRVLLWDAASGEIRWELEGAHRSKVNGPMDVGVSALAFSPDGSLLAAQGPDLRVACYDVNSGRLRFSTSDEAELAPVLDLAFSPDGLLLAAANALHALLIWDARDGRLLHHLPNAPAQLPVADVEFSPDGLTLASAGFDGRILLRDARSPLKGSPRVIRAHDAKIRDLAYSPDGKMLASAAADGTVRLWDPVGGSELALLRPDCPDVFALAYSPDGKMLASAGAGQSLTLFDAESRRPVRTLDGHVDSVYTLAYSPDGRTLASAGADRTVRLWDPEHPAQPRTLIEPEPSRFFQRPFALAFSPDGSRIAAGFEDSALRIWELPGGEVSLARSAVDDWGDRRDWSVYSLTFSPDGRTLAVGTPDHRVILRDAGSGALLREIGRHGDTIKALAFGPDGRTLASASNDGTLALWDLEGGEAVFTFEGQDQGVLDVAFSPDGSRIASASNNGTVAILRAADGEVLSTFEGHSNSVCGVAFAPDGRTVVSAGADGTIQLWEAESGRIDRVMTGHRGTVLAVCISPDGRRIASAGVDRTARLWDSASGLELMALRDHDGWIRRLAFSPDGDLLASASDDGTVKLRDARPLDEDSAQGDSAGGARGAEAPRAISRK